MFFFIRYLLSQLIYVPNVDHFNISQQRNVWELRKYSFFFFVCIFPIWHWTTQEHWHWHWDKREEILVSREITLVEKDWAVNCSRKEVLLFSEFQILSENFFSTLVCTQRKRVSRTSLRFSFLRVTHLGYYFSQKLKLKPIMDIIFPKN